MKRMYLIKTEDYINPVPRGKVSVYKIVVGEKVYIGATANCKGRFATHSALIEKAVQLNKETKFFAQTYPNITIDEVKANKYRFEVIKTYVLPVAAAILELRLQDEYRQKGLLINCDNKNTYKLFRKRKVKTGRRYYAL